MVLPVVGVDQQGFLGIETAFDTHKLHVTADSCGYLEMEIEPFLEYHANKEHVGSASLQGESKGKQGGTWKMKVNVKPDTAGAAPDIGPALEAGMGNVSGSTYTFTATAPKSLQLCKKTSDDLIEFGNGAWVAKVEVDQAGNEEGMITVSGGFASYGCLTAQPVAGTEAVGQTVIDVAAGAAAQIVAEGSGILVKFGSKDNTGAGYLITDVDYVNDTITITPALAAGDNTTGVEVIQPLLPTYTVSGTIQGGTECDLSIGGTSLGFNTGKYVIETGIHGLDKQATANRVTQLARGARSTSLEFEVYYLEDEADIANKAWAAALYSTVWRLGPSTANNNMTVNCLSTRYKVTPVKVPEAEEATALLAGVPRKSAANEDEGSIVFA